MAQLSTLGATHPRMTKDWQDATSGGDTERVRALLDAGADINSLDRHGQTALMNSAHKGYTEIVRLLCQRGAGLNHTAKYHLSALMLAVIGDHSDVVRILVDAGADVGHRGFGNKTALELAEEMKRTLCVEILQHTNTEHEKRA